MAVTCCGRTRIAYDVASAMVPRDPSDPARRHRRLKHLGLGVLVLGAAATAMLWLRPPPDARPLSFGAFSIADVTLDGEGLPGGWVETAPGTLERRHGDVIEVLRRAGAGAFHGFWVPRRPTGDLTLTLTFSAATARGGPDTASLDVPGGSPWRYGPATLVDARGERYPVRLEGRGPHVSLHVPAARWAALAFPALIDPYVGPEVQLDAPVLIPFAGGSQLQWHGSGWYQAMVAFWYPTSYLLDVPADAGPTQLARSTGLLFARSLGTLGGEPFLVRCEGIPCTVVGDWLWRDGGISEFPLGSSRLDRSQVVQGTTLLWWTWAAQQGDGGFAVRARRIDLRGPIDAAPIEVGTLPTEDYKPSGAGDALDVTWLESPNSPASTVHWQRVWEDGGVEASRALPTPDWFQMGSFGGPSSSLLLGHKIADGGIAALRLGRDGGVTRSDFGPPVQTQFGPVVTAMGDDYLVFTGADAGTRLVGVVLAPDGSVSAWPAFVASATARLFAVAASSGSTEVMLVVQDEGKNGLEQLYLPLDGGAANARQYAWQWPSLSDGVTATISGDRVLVAWEDDRETGSLNNTTAWATLTDTAGTVLTRPFPLASSVQLQAFDVVQAAATPRGWDVQLMGPFEIDRVQVGFDAGVTAPEVISSGGLTGFIRSAGSSRGVLHVFTRFQATFDVQYRRWDAAGVALDPAPVTLGTVPPQYPPVVEGSDYVLFRSSTTSRAIDRIPIAGGAHVTLTAPPSTAQCWRPLCVSSTCFESWSDDAGSWLAPLDGGTAVRLDAAPCTVQSDGEHLWAMPTDTDGGNVYQRFDALARPVGAQVSLPFRAGDFDSPGDGGALVFGVWDGRELHARLAWVGDRAAGQTCSLGTDCASSHCVDGVCCDTACGGGVPGDCQACSVAAGATADGTCAVVPRDTLCRPEASFCDVAERCDGTSTGCPGDVTVPGCDPDAARALRVGCGCQSVVPAALAPLVALLRRRRRVRGRG